jgi:hypothetical protein
MIDNFFTRSYAMGYSLAALRALAFAYPYAQKRTINREKCPDLHFYVAHPCLWPA